MYVETSACIDAYQVRLCLHVRYMFPLEYQITEVSLYIHDNCESPSDRVDEEGVYENLPEIRYMSSAPTTGRPGVRIM